MNVHVHIVISSLAGLLSAPAFSQHTDIFVGLDGPQVITGQITKDKMIDLTVKVHEAEFGDSGFEGFTSDPGFNAEPVFNPAFRIGFNILAPLLFWNGAGFEDTGGETLNISFLSASRDTAECFVAGFDLPVQPNGGWHTHFGFFLNPDRGGVRDPGIYLLKLELYYTAPGSIESQPFWIAFNHLASEENHEAAVEWANAHLAYPTCPADINASGDVNVDDLLTVISGWGASPCAVSDLDGDGFTNVDDLLTVINGWGTCPPP